MKILFIWPNYDCPIGLSIGVSYLSSILKQRGYQTAILHICEMLGTPFVPEELLIKVEEIDPDLIAVSTGENHYTDMEELCKEVKNRSPHIKIILGGIHVTLNAETVFTKESVFDFAIRGEGEDAIAELVDSIAQGKQITDIKNVWFKGKNEIIKNPMRPLKQNFTLPYMDLESWDFEKITELRRGWVNVSMNRGCPYRCTFCHNLSEVRILKQDFGTKGTSNAELHYLRLRDIDNMIQELCWIKESYPFVKAFSFVDDTFTFDQEYMKKFFTEYKEKVHLPFVCLTTINDVDDDLLQMMKEANCDLIRFGIESTSERICKNIIRRKFSQEKMISVFQKCRDIGLRTFSYNIIAHPSETREEMKSTMRWNARLKPSGIRVSLGYPYKGTDYYEIAKQMGLIDETLSFHNYSTYSKFKFSRADKCWIDKFRSFFWWWLNSYLDNECSEEYGQLVEKLEWIPTDKWDNEHGTIYRSLLDMDGAVSQKYVERKVAHYVVPYGDRPDIALFYDNGELLKKEMLDEH